MKEIKNYYDLSYPQLGIWQLEKTIPNTSIGNLSATLRIEKNLDFSLMDKAMNYIIQKNEALRIRLSEIDGEPKQYVVPYKYKKIDIFDFSNKNISELYEWDTKMTRKPFYDLDSPLFYTSFLRITENAVALYVKFHHSIGDAWTLVKIGNDLMIYYQKLLDGETIDETPGPSYFDYIEKEQTYLKSERFLKDQVFWLDKFKHLPELNTLKPNQFKKLNLKTKRKTYKIPKKLANKIRQHCSEHKTSIFSLYLSAIALYFNRTQGCDEVIFGTPVLNRSNRKDKDTYGMFISTAPIKVTIDDNQSYNTFAESINSEWMSLLKHQKYPYTELLKNLREKNKRFNKLYDIVISYQNAKFIKSDDELQHEGRWHLPGYQTETLNIHINDRESDDTVIIDYDYLSDLFYEKEIDYLHNHITSLLWHSIDNPMRKLPLIEMISEVEKQKILYDFNDTQKKYPIDKTIQELFEQQVAMSSNLDCIVFNNEKMTYDQFNKHSNQMARFLREKGIKTNDIVSILQPRSLDMMISIMGIIKAGGAYLPLDPEYPAERIEYIMNDSQSKYLLTHSSLNDLTYNINNIIEIDKISINNYDTSNISTVTKPNDLLYVIYTSGTEGNPKGVMIENKSLINFIFGINDLLEFKGNSKVLSVTNSTFDIFVFENFTSLLSGSCIVLATEESQSNPLTLKKTIINHNIDILLTTPSRMQMLINDDSFMDFLENVKVIMLGGEVFPQNLLKKLKILTNAKIVNGYGPTETTIGVSFKVIDNVINIGKPIANTNMYILDKHMNLLPIGVPGELYIGGDCLARGYLNNNVLTEKSFVKNPFDKTSKIYKTGDIARWYAKGDVEFISRNDSQIKINGYRIELLEIQKAILNYEGVKDVIVTTNIGEQQNVYLCAYLIYDNDLSIKSLKTLLATRLPKYMIPSFYVKIDTIPLTISGKIDLTALPKPEIHLDFKQKLILPRDKTEKAIASIWYELLSMDLLGIDDDFFEIGGDSLSAIRLVSILYKNNISISLQDIYQYPTIRKLSNFVINREFDNIEHLAITDCSLSNSHICFEQKSLEELILSNKLPPIDSAAITYIPEDIIESLDFYKKPMLFNYMKTAQGNIGLFSIPLSSKDLYSDKNLLLELCALTIEEAQKLGAKMISLTGLIPSATSYGYDIAEKLQQMELKANITTGHSTTAASVILSIERLLKSSNRNIQNEDIVLLGVGSVGTAVMNLLLSVLDHPRSIVLCDIRQKQDFLDSFRKTIKTKFGFKGNISIALSDHMKLPSKVYSASLIIGATNVPNVLDVDKLKPGTLIIDDSGPHCFNKEKAIKRLQMKQDILFTEGGVLESPSIISKKIYLPIEIRETVLNSYYQHFASDKEITGCILSSLLSVKFEKLNPVLGITKLQECIVNYTLLKELKYNGAMPHCDNYLLPDKFISEFKKSFGIKLWQNLELET